MRKIAALLRHRQTPPPAQPSLAILAILAILGLGVLACKKGSQAKTPSAGGGR